MDYDSSSKFISSLAKFLQSLCNGYVEFDTGVQVIGHLYLSVDTGKTIDYILNEKVCKTDENSVTFISNSFHAQPAERPKPPGKRQGKDSDKTELKNEEESDNGISAQVEPRSTNVGTLPSVRNTKQNSPHSHGGKRPYSPSLKQSQSKSGRTSPKHKKSRSESLDLNTSQLSNPAGENSMSSAPSPTADSGPSNSVSARGSDASHGPQVNESYQQGFYQPDEEGSLADETEERDVKPSIDTDVTFIKEEFAPSSGCSQTGGQSHDRTHGDDPYSYQPNQIYPGSYPGQGGFGASSQRSNFSSSGPSHMFSPGQSSSQVEENSGDPTGAWWDEQAVVRSSLLQVQAQSHAGALLPTPSYFVGSSLATLRNLTPGFACRTCSKSFVSRAHLLKHRHFCAGSKAVTCSECGKAFGRRYNLRVHMRNVHGIGETISCKACSTIFRSYLKLNEHMQTCRVTSKSSAKR